jgi:hypothetical protein
MVEYNDRRPWSFTTPGDEDWNTPLDRKSAKAANERLRSEDHSERLGSQFHVTNRAIRSARKDMRKSRAAGDSVEPPTVGDYMTRVQEHVSNLVHTEVYSPKRGIR